MRIIVENKKIIIIEYKMSTVSDMKTEIKEDGHEEEEIDIDKIQAAMAFYETENGKLKEEIRWSLLC